MASDTKHFLSLLLVLQCVQLWVECQPLLLAEWVRLESGITPPPLLGPAFPSLWSLPKARSGLSQQGGLRTEGPVGRSRNYQAFWGLRFERVAGPAQSRKAWMAGREGPWGPELPESQGLHFLLPPAPEHLPPHPSQAGQQGTECLSGRTSEPPKQAKMAVIWCDRTVRVRGHLCLISCQNIPLVHAFSPLLLMTFFLPSAPCCLTLP